MDSLIDLVLGNLWLIVIVIGIVSSIFGKKGDAGRQGQERSPSRPSVPGEEGGQPQRMTMREVYRQAIGELEKQMSPESEAQVRESRVPDVQTEPKTEVLKRAEAELRASEQKRKQAEARSQQLGRPAISDEESPIYVKDMEFGRDRLAEGIILSEVLGAPRSRKPHKSRRY